MSLNRNFWLFAVGRFVSQLGWAVQDVALPLYVLDKTHSGSMMTLFILAEIIPSLIVMPFAGVVGDRYNRKWLMVGFDLIRGILLFGVIAFNFLGIYQLLAVQVVMAVLGSFFSAGTGAMFPDLVEPDELEKANSTVSSFTILARLVGPALGGLIYGIGGIKLAILINAVSFFGSGLFEMLIRYEWKAKPIEGIGQVFSDIKEGVRFIFGHHYLRTLMTFAIFMGIFGAPFGAVLLPYAMREVLKFTSFQFGLMESFFMGGALIGNILIAVKFGKGAGKFLFEAMLLNGLVMVLFIWLISPLSKLEREGAFIVLTATSVVWGVSEAFISIPIDSKIQRAVPSEVRGRVFSALGILTNIATPLGLVLVGPLLNVYPAWLVTLGLWIGMGAVALYYWLRYREILLMDVRAKERLKEGKETLT
ncbi:MFS transporter [Thermococcus eurythermalis]|uniref:MFS transporter n=1 Tax=Thermococcus eurythermalis TaxID=1505907 RepID=A0A097QVR8_9EURY|nr:MFS transporter [Thermococcus eurythermalis]AIU70562.1 MFS transporter [Thermococcus eurythermalis]